MKLKRFEDNENDEHTKKGNALKVNDGFSDGLFFGEGDSEDEFALVLRNMNCVYIRGNFRRGRRFTRGNKAISLSNPKCYESKSTEKLIADYLKLKEREAKLIKKDNKGKKGKGLTSSWDKCRSEMMKDQKMNSQTSVSWKIWTMRYFLHFLILALSKTFRMILINYFQVYMWK